MVKAEPLHILRSIWGYPAFRPGQERAIRGILDGQDVLALLPTGAGKSLCYQVPALMLPGVTVVISPLIALMKDQVDQLRDRGIRADAIHAGLSARDIDRILDNAVFSGIKVLFISPERLRSDLAEARIRRMPIDLIAVDEAHCISQWGYDFRPAYLEIAKIREWIPEAPILALTATATPDVVTDIQEKLAFRKSLVIRTTFRRPNLRFIVEDRRDKEMAMVRWLEELPGTAIVYIRSRKRTQEFALFLRERNITAEAFHAGLDASTRFRLQEDWKDDRIRVMVATNAFGMGIDKPDVRLVVHVDLPDSLEAYYQEAGRAGRDGNPAAAVLLAGEPDLLRLEKHMDERFPPVSEIRQVYRALGSYLQLAFGSGEGFAYDFDLGEFSRRFEFQPARALAALRILEESGWLTLSDSVFQPATLWIKAPAADLYTFQLKNRQVDQLIRAAQRLYQGLGQYPVAIQVSKLMDITGLSATKIEQVFHFLDQSGLIEYQQTRERPQLTFLRAREDADRLALDLDLLNFRKDRHQARIRSVREYLEEPECRQIALVRYFGESMESPCGQCDRCLARTGAKAGPDRGMARLEERLRTLFRQQEEWAPAELQKSFDRDEISGVRMILQSWSDQGFLRESYGKLILDT